MSRSPSHGFSNSSSRCNKKQTSPMRMINKKTSKITNSTTKSEESSKPSASKNDSILRYCQKSCSELIENKPVEGPVIHETHLKPKLNDSDDDFRSPLVLRKRSNLAWKLKKIPIKKSKSKKSSKKTINSTIEIIKDNFKKDEDNPEHLQMAIALSKSSYEAEYGRSCEANDETPDVTEILKNAKKTNLEQFGFKVSKPVLAVESRRQHSTELPKKLRNRFKYITPILEIRTQEDRESLIASKISQILSGSNDYAKRTVEKSVFSSKLQSFYRRKTPVFSLDSIYEKNAFYLDTLNIPRNNTKCGCLLKDWRSIPGREGSPDRHASLAGPVAVISPDVNYDFLRTGNIDNTEENIIRENMVDKIPYQHSQTNPSYIEINNEASSESQKSCIKVGSSDPSASGDSLVNSFHRSISPELFGSEDELSYGDLRESRQCLYNSSSEDTNTLSDVNCEAPLKSCSSNFGSTLTKVASFYSLDEFEDGTESGLKEYEKNYSKEKVNASSHDVSNDIEEIHDGISVNQNSPGLSESDSCNGSAHQGLPNDTCDQFIGFNNYPIDNHSKDPSIKEESTITMKNRKKKFTSGSFSKNEQPTDELDVSVTSSLSDSSDKYSCGCTNTDQNLIKEADLSSLSSVMTASDMQEYFNKKEEDKLTRSKKCNFSTDGYLVKEGVISVSSDVPNSREEHEILSSEMKNFVPLDSVPSKTDQSLDCIEILDDTQPDHYFQTKEDEASTSGLYESISNEISVSGAHKSPDLCTQDDIRIKGSTTFEPAFSENIDHQVLSHGTTPNKLPSLRNSLGYNSADLNVTEYVIKLLNRNKSSFENDFWHLADNESDEMSLSGNSQSSTLIDEELNYSCHFATPSRRHSEPIGNFELDKVESPENEILGMMRGHTSVKPSPIKSVEDTGIIGNKLVSTPENYTIKTENVTPILRYDEMTTPLINKELQKFGVKPLKRARGAKLLKYIYESTHPIVDTIEVVEKIASEDDENFIKRRKVCHDATSNRLTYVKTDGLNFESFCSLIEISGDRIIENERPEDLIFENKKSKKLPSCQVPLQIVWHNFLCCNPAIRENILLYEPLQLESVHMMLKEQGYKFHMQDLLTFLDRKCITIRTVQKGRQQHI